MTRADMLRLHEGCDTHQCSVFSRAITIPYGKTVFASVKQLGYTEQLPFKYERIEPYSQPFGEEP